jgi:hypothetical protein
MKQDNVRESVVSQSYRFCKRPGYGAQFPSSHHPDRLFSTSKTTMKGEVGALSPEVNQQEQEAGPCRS